MDVKYNTPSSTRPTDEVKIVAGSGYGWKLLDVLDSVHDLLEDEELGEAAYTTIIQC